LCLYLWIRQYDYVNGDWTPKYKHEFQIEGVDKTFTGGNRYEQTLTATGEYVDDILNDYGDQMFGYDTGKKSKK